MIKDQGYPILLDEFFRCEEPDLLSQTDMENINDPIHKMDEGIEDNIAQALWKNDILRVTDLNEIEIHVNNGVVFMSGHVLSSTNHQRIEKALQTVPGIHSIRSNLVMDDELMREVAGSLALLEHTHNCKFFTGVSHGVVILSGDVSSEEIRISAEQTAAKHPRVRGVINNIRVSDVDPVVLDSRFLQPAIGTEMYFRDGVFGVARLVVINPDNRRVISVVIQGHFNNLRQNLGSFNQTAVSPSDQMLVIPMSDMGYLTTNSGALTISSTEVTREQKFDPTLFIAPPKTWVPPFPYCLREVLFPMEPSQPGNINIAISAPVQPISTKENLKIAAELNTNDSLGG